MEFAKCRQTQIANSMRSKHLVQNWQKNKGVRAKLQLPKLLAEQSILILINVSSQHYIRQ